jgi:hypothetical protein
MYIIQILVYKAKRQDSNYPTEKGISKKILMVVLQGPTALILLGLPSIHGNPHEGRFHIYS